MNRTVTLRTKGKNIPGWETKESGWKSAFINPISYEKP
jgi:hypothetical protein